MLYDGVEVGNAEMALQIFIIKDGLFGLFPD